MSVRSTDRIVGAPTTPAGAMASFKPVFDYTHLGPESAEYVSAMVAKALAEAVPELGGQLLP